MGAVAWVTTSLLVVHAAHSYILITANMDDVQEIAKQMLSSPVVTQVEKIWRRATAQFNQRLRKPDRVQHHDGELNKAAGSSSGSRSRFLDDSFRRRGRRVLNDLSALSRNASEYLQSLRRVFNYLTDE